MIALVVLMRFWQPARRDDQAAPDAPAATLTASELADLPNRDSGRHRSGLEGVAAVAVPHRLRLRSGACNPVKDSAQRLVRAADPGARPAPRGAARCRRWRRVPTLEKTIFNLNLPVRHRHARCCSPASPRRCLGVGFRRRCCGSTARRCCASGVSLLTISVMMALGFMTRYGGTDTTMGLAMAGTGSLFPFFSPMLGWLGVALTGSDTSSNVLFGNLQKVTAEQLGYSPILMCAANSSGGVMGKMIDAQSIVVARGGDGRPRRQPRRRHRAARRVLAQHRARRAGRAAGLRAGEDLSVHGDGRARRGAATPSPARP